MPDIRVVPVATPDVVTLDWLQTPAGLLDETNELASAVTVAICTDGLAGSADVLPDPNSDDRRGWWADQDADTIWNGWPIGAKLWLLTRAKILSSAAREGATVTRVQSYIQACLQPFVAAKICSRFTVTAAQTGPETIVATVIIYRGPKSAISLQFQAVWNDLGFTVQPLPAA